MIGQIARATALIEQKRYQLAERELASAIAEAPDAGFPRALFALCLSHREAHKEALDHARQAIGAEPDLDYAHYVLSLVLAKQDRLTEASAAIEEAIRIDPTDADYHAHLATIEIGREKPEAALQAAERALALDAENRTAINLRAIALIRLGRKDEAGKTMEGALARNPQSSFTHSNMGWTQLHANNPKAALDYFRESLRLDPTNEHARSGMVEALKARHLIYRWMLRYFLWMARQSAGTQWAFIIGLYVLVRIISAVAKSNPGLQPYLTPILVAYVLFVIMSWLAVPAFNLVLRFNKFGKHALSPVQRSSAHWFGGLLGLALAFGVGWILTNHGLFKFGGIYFGLAIFPVAMTTSTEHDAHRRRLWIYTGMLLAVGLAGFPIMAFNPSLGGMMAGMYGLGCLWFSWIASAIRSGRTYT